VNERDEKARFMIGELGILSRYAALATRDNENPIYARELPVSERNEAASVIRKTLGKMEATYADGRVSEAEHIKYIDDTANTLTATIGPALHLNRFRIGVSQKLINVYLKYLWAANLIPEPPHCPIDGRIRDIAKIEYDWTTSDSIDDYRRAIELLTKVAGYSSLAAWELREFRRREDE
jgi:hypothetical protein